MTRVRYGRAASAIGEIWIARTDAGVAACSRDESPEAMLDALHRRFRDVSVEPADGRAAALASTPRIDLRGLSEFDAAVYGVVAGIPAGETMTYGDVARRVGSPGGARAVGGAMARCPLFPAVPCHRVVRAADGWSGWGGAADLKRRLLAAERERR